jgi:DNA-binding MarR family transcriptional regulator
MAQDGSPDGGDCGGVLRRFLQRLARDGLLEPSRYAGTGLTASEVAALAELAEDAGAGGLSQRELGERLGLEKSTVSRLAAGLEGRGWLVRERDPANRRFYRLRLTAPGRELARRVVADLDDHRRDLLGALTDAERAALTRGLRALNRVLDEAAGERSGTGREAG